MKTQPNLRQTWLGFASLLVLATGVFAQDNTSSTKAGADGILPLCTEDGAPKAWVVRAWNDVKDPPAQPTEWKIEQGVLHGGEPRGSWLMSKKEYGDFILEFEFK